MNNIKLIKYLLSNILFTKMIVYLHKLKINKIWTLKF
jgi:hypothetical protein